MCFMLSATPIPRTLALSLKGLRSISVLNEAPHNRIPVVTHRRSMEYLHREGSSFQGA